jgi:hypothetical protein
LSNRLRWPAIVGRAAEIVNSYSTLVTLRQLFYRLVSEGAITNTDTSYKTLSARTAEARRAGLFPDLIDRTRVIHRPLTFTSPGQAQTWLHDHYRRDRTEGQVWSVFLGVEKAGMVNQLDDWFGALGIPLLALGGYASQSFVDDVAADVDDQERPAVLLYAGDHDASGEDIDRDFIDRAACFDEVVRVALSAQQVVAYGLPPMPGKATDTRAAGFVAKHGELRQVELDALDPNDLRGLYQAALAPFWDVSTYRAVVAREEQERHQL